MVDRICSKCGEERHPKDTRDTTCVWCRAKEREALSGLFLDEGSPRDPSHVPTISRYGADKVGRSMLPSYPRGGSAYQGTGA